MTEIINSDIGAFFDECARNSVFESFAPGDEEKLAALLKRWDIGPGMRIVEPGCGAGRVTERLADAVGPGGLVYAFDLSEEMIRRARARKLPGSVRFACGSVEAIPTEDALFDIAVCFSVFPHFSDPPAALDELHRVLKPGGQLWINHFRNRASLNEMHRNASQVIIAHELPDAVEMKRLLATHGFIVTELLDSAKTEYSLLAVASDI